MEKKKWVMGERKIKNGSHYVDNGALCSALFSHDFVVLKLGQHFFVCGISIPISPGVH